MSSTRLVGIVIAILAVALTGCYGPIGDITIAQAGDNGISVSGTGEAKVIPNKAEIYAGIETLAQTAAQAEQLNAQQSEAVIEALNKVGIRKADIETSSYYVQPQYDYQEFNGRQEIVGYTASHTLLIETENLDNVGAIIDAAVNAGANHINGVQFTLTEEARAQAYRDVLGEATKDAEAKATAIAQALGVTIVGVQKASTDYGITPIYMAKYDMVEEQAMGAPRTEILPGEVDVSANVNVVFTIE